MATVTAALSPVAPQQKCNFGCRARSLELLPLLAPPAQLSQRPANQSLLQARLGWSKRRLQITDGAKAGGGRAGWMVEGWVGACRISR
jgi:hypothetical protein